VRRIQVALACVTAAARFSAVMRHNSLAADTSPVVAEDMSTADPQDHT
jgi:hypothetical protein